VERKRREIVEKFTAIESKAEELSFFELKRYVGQLRDALTQSDQKVLYETSGVLLGRTKVEYDARRPLDMETIFSVFERTVESLEGAFVASRDPAQAAWMASEDHRCQSAIELLASHSNFDSGLAAFVLQQKMLQRLQSSSATTAEAKIRAAELKAIQEQKTKEIGFLKIWQRVLGMTSAKEVNLIGKSEWVIGHFWAAEAAWSRAIELEDGPSYRTNRALVRTILGRRMRSEGV
jgi:hypothetical protein